MVFMRRFGVAMATSPSNQRAQSSLFKRASTSPRGVAWGLAMLPIGPKGRVSVTNGIAAAGNSASRHPDAVRQILAWMGSGAGNAWSIMAVDDERDLLFVPTGSASPDYYGGERLGNNLFANSVVALRADTGQRVWHFQTVHHDLWDYDVASPPVLFDVHRNGQTIPAIGDIGAAQWDSCANPAAQLDSQLLPYNPFTSHDFLSALEASDSAVARKLDREKE